MRYASVCSGVEAASLAWMPLGWEPVWFSEIEPFPCEVLKQRFPGVQNLGDMTKINGEKYAGTVDLLVGGTPCQGFSVAGKQGGLGDPRSALCLAYCRLLETMRPRWFVWENVPGVFSTNGGEDFKAFLRKIDEIGYSCAWRVLDAQYVRVDGYPRALPQRRRRVFVVGYLGEWQYPASVLFEPGCLFRDSPPRRTKGQAPAAGTEGGIDTAKSIRMRAGKPGGGKGALIGDDLSHTLATGNDQTVIYTVHGAQTPISNDNHANALGCSNSGLENCVCISKQKKPEGRFWNGEDVAGTLTVTSDRQLMPDKGRLQCVIEQQEASVECMDTRQVDVHDTDLAPTLIATDYKGGKAICYENHAQDSRIKPVEVSQSIVARMGTGGGNLPLVKEPDIIGFIKNDAGGIQQGFWKNVFPTLRAAITPAITWNECFHLSFCDANGTRKDRRNGGLYVTKAETSQTVTAKGPHTETVIIALDGDKMAKAERKGGSGLGVSEDGVMYTQTVKDVHAVAYDECVPLDLRNATRDPEKHDAQNRQGVGVGEDGAPMNTVTATSVPGIGWQATVRKLLPVECERLMGFPDNWTRIPWRGKPAEECPDSPRYKACGNSMCVNVMRWIGMRIENVERKMR